VLLTRSVVHLPSPLLVLLAASATMVACQDDPVDEGPDPGVEPDFVHEPWPGEDVRPTLDHPFFDDHPGLGDLSLYATHVSGPVEDRPPPQHRGSHAVGNGRVFSLLGLTDPLNTLHSMVGPRYEKEDYFFADVATVLEADGVEAPFVEEWIARVRGAAVIVTRADTAEHSLYTVDFAPLPAGTDPLDVPPAVVRVLLATGIGTDTADIAVRLRPSADPADLDGMAVETLPTDGRYRAYLPWGCDLAQDASGHLIELGDVGPAQTAMAVLVVATGESLDELEAIADSLATADAEGWLDQTLAQWDAFSDRGVQIDVADERVVDLYDGMRVGIRVQQSAAGAVCPMSRYTGVWLRDTIGPTRFFLRAGLHDEARQALDYLYLCASVEGDYSNQCASGLTPDDLIEPPDWDSLGPWSGRLAAEGPSYVPLMYREFAAFTGDMDVVQDRWPYIRRAVLAQSIDDDGLQPHSGDETYRVAMSAALGHDLNTLYEETAWSANSSFLMAAAADWLADAAAQIGEDEDEATFLELAARARSAMDQHFWLDEGHYAPFIWYDGPLPEIRPYEDVNLKPLWTGALGADDPLALSNLAGLREAAGRGDGTVQTPLDPEYHEFMGFEVEDGICTGMVPGYYLYNLAIVGDPEAEDAFDALHLYADEGGQYTEYQVYDDFSPLAPLYDPLGGLGDYTARHRPWEGGINLDAFLVYLIGPMLVPGEDVVVLRPHLPDGLGGLEVRQIEAGGCEGDLSVARDNGSVVVSLISRATESFTIQMEVPIPRGAVFGEWSELGGADAGELVPLPGGEEVVRFEDVVLEAGAVVEFEVGLAQSGSEGR
jgi:hypothetical protein